MLFWTPVLAWLALCGLFVAILIRRWRAERFKQAWIAREADRIYRELCQRDGLDPDNKGLGE